MILSVVICTYNRADLLSHTLQDICKQNIDQADYEVIVIDNNSSDHTRSVVEEISRCNPHISIRYILELQQGHTFARNRGWQEAHGEYIAYADDDCQIPPQWLAVARDVITQHVPSAFGGPYFPFYNTPKPRWYQDRYATHEHGSHARPLKEGEYLDGMNIFFRKSVFLDIGGFQTTLGMSGKRIGYGDETEVLIRIRKMRPDELIYYDPRLFVHHLVRPEKLRLSWIIRSFLAAGRDCRAIFPAPSSTSKTNFQLFCQLMAIFGELGKAFIVALFKRDRKKYPYIENYLFECSFNYWYTLGGLYTEYRMKNHH